MKETRIMMGMPITVEIVDAQATQESIDAVFDYFEYIDETFSTYKENSEISRINRREIGHAEYSSDMRTVLALAELTRQETDGYFDIMRRGFCDPSGLVKGWAINNAANLLRQKGFANFYVDAGGDIQADGKNNLGQAWRVGIRNPFDIRQIIKVISISNCGIATSGTYVRGDHIYNPKNFAPLKTEVVSLTVVGPNVYEADRFATAAFAMGRDGIVFIENLPEFEGYLIDQNHQATFTSGFNRYVCYD